MWDANTGAAKTSSGLLAKRTINTTCYVSCHSLFKRTKAIMDGTTSEINMSKILVDAGCYVALEAGETWSYHFVAMAKQLQVQTE